MAKTAFFTGKFLIDCKKFISRFPLGLVYIFGFLGITYLAPSRGQYWAISVRAKSRSWGGVRSHTGRREAAASILRLRLGVRGSLGAAFGVLGFRGFGVLGFWGFGVLARCPWSIVNGFLGIGY